MQRFILPLCAHEKSDIRPKKVAQLDVNILVIFAAAVMLLLASDSAFATVYPSNTLYYISNTGCSNANAGTSSTAPWCDFTNVNGSTFSQGDQILLQSGGSWASQIAPLGNGASGNPVILGCYPASSCSTNYPVINPGSQLSAVSLINPSFWTITNLSMTGGLNGIHINFSQLGNQGLVLQNLNIHDMAGTVSAILIDGMNTNPPTLIASNQYVISGITFSNITISKAGAIYLTAGYANAQQVNNGYPNAQQNVLMKNVTASNFSDCFVFANIENVVVTDGSWTQGDVNGRCGAAVYLVAASNVTFNNVLSYNDAFTNANDNAAFVYDNQETQLRWRGNYFYKNAAAGIEGAENLCFKDCTASTNFQFEVSNSTFYDNSTQAVCTVPANPTATYGYYGDISVAYSPQTQMTVQNNLYSDTPQSCNGFVVRANSAYQTLTNNINFGSNGLYNSLSQFSGTQGQYQWNYEYWNGSAWLVNTPTYNSATGTWIWNTGAFINNFDMQPDTCTNCWTARFWTAPQAGTIHVTGWVLKNSTGTPAQVGIYHGGTNPGWVWGSANSWYTLGANDQIGVPTLATVVVAKGDTLQFVVGNQSGLSPSGALVSWMPSIAYQ
ncbi:hypothetical protein [Tunturibacter empetritectus]|uniref:Right-handed parallel beta-helix repeat-containing protein n=1 Tax=Tunturiibacter lichenicola TaxID=2051959 RepID=A0A7W8N2S1_9BACT|nr:hypothetical protein [Edaphobacter lichenicola]MBB5343369.1 hypothetical protein [Edaphobacter lichenicola]